MFTSMLHNNQTTIALQQQPFLSLSSVAVHVKPQQRVPVELQDLTPERAHGVLENGTCTVDMQAGGEWAALSFSALLAAPSPLFAKGRFFSAASSAVLSFSLADFTSAVAIYQHKDWWLRPEFCKTVQDIPARTQLLLLKAGNVYCAVVAVADKYCRCDISGGENLTVSLSSNTDTLSSLAETALVLYAGSNPYQCCENACKKAMELCSKPYPLKKQKQLPEMMEYLGWCSWDAFYHKINQQGVLEKMDEFAEKKIPVKWVLIDDGWLDADYTTQQLKGLDAAPEKFPGGLAETTALLKNKYGVQHVGVWHAIMGYWNGVYPNSPAHNSLAAFCKQTHQNQFIPQFTPESAFGFWNTWHSFLRQNGISFVKVDGQSAISNYGWGNSTYGEACRGMHTALEASCAVHFDNRLINCMGMAPEDVWNRPNSAVSRNSDDFVPFTENGFREHAIQNAYNSLLHGQFYYGDWDMFWSDHAESKANAMLRAVSGGPVYTSDKVGESSPEAIAPLILADGRILRCDDAGLPTVDCLFRSPVEEQRPLKVFNRKNDAVFIAAFNIGSKAQPASYTLSLTDIPEWEGPAWVYSYNTKTVELLEQGAELCHTLAPADANMFVMAPCNSRPAVLGNTEKYISTGVIHTIFWNDSFCDVVLHETSAITIAFSGENIRFYSGGNEQAAEKHDNCYILPCDNIHGKTFRIEWR